MALDRRLATRFLRVGMMSRNLLNRHRNRLWEGRRLGRHQRPVFEHDRRARRGPVSARRHECAPRGCSFGRDRHETPDRHENSARLLRRAGARLGAITIAASFAFAAPAQAQNDKMTPIAIPAQPDAIVLGTGPLPGATAPESLAPPIWQRIRAQRHGRDAHAFPAGSGQGDRRRGDRRARAAASAPCRWRMKAGTSPGRSPRKGVAAFVLKYRLEPDAGGHGRVRAVDARRCSPAPRARRA